MSKQYRNLLDLKWLFITVVLTGICGGCTTTRNDQSTAGVTSSNEYKVQQSGHSVTGLSFTVGPYQTTSFSSYAMLGTARTEPVCKVQQVSFANDKLIRVFDISSKTGPGVHVQIGREGTGQTKKFGFLTSEKPGPTTGVLTREGQFVGSFTVIPPLMTSWGLPRAPAAGESAAFATLQTPVGTISGEPQTEEVQRSSKLDEMILGTNRSVDVYLLEGKTIAKYDGSMMWFDDDLPHDARLYIVAQMSLRAFTERVMQDAQAINSLNASTARLSR